MLRSFLLAIVFGAAACGGHVVDEPGRTITDETTATDGGVAPSEGPPEVIAPTGVGAFTADTAAAAALCVKTGGTVVETYCSGQPPFAAETCAQGTAWGICDPAPGENTPTTPECNCGTAHFDATSRCFDPIEGCIDLDAETDAGL